MVRGAGVISFAGANVSAFSGGIMVGSMGRQREGKGILGLGGHSID